MALYISPEVFGKVVNQILFLNTPSFLPFVLLIAPNLFSEVSLVVTGVISTVLHLSFSPSFLLVSLLRTADMSIKNKYSAD